MTTSEVRESIKGCLNIFTIKEIKGIDRIYYFIKYMFNYFYRKFTSFIINKKFEPELNLHNYFNFF